MEGLDSQNTEYYSQTNPRFFSRCNLKWKIWLTTERLVSIFFYTYMFFIYIIEYIMENVIKQNIRQNINK